MFCHIFCSLKDRVKKITVEKEALESHLKNEKDEKELYKVMSKANAIFLLGLNKVSFLFKN